MIIFHLVVFCRPTRGCVSSISVIRPIGYFRYKTLREALIDINERTCVVAQKTDQLIKEQSLCLKP
jgi:hypothetical protein